MMNVFIYVTIKTSEKCKSIREYTKGTIQIKQGNIHWDFFSIQIATLHKCMRY